MDSHVMNRKNNLRRRKVVKKYFRGTIVDGATLRRRQGVWSGDRFTFRVWGTVCGEENAPFKILSEFMPTYDASINTQYTRSKFLQRHRHHQYHHQKTGKASITKIKRKQHAVTQQIA